MRFPEPGKTILKLSWGPVAWSRIMIAQLQVCNTRNIGNKMSCEIWKYVLIILHKLHQNIAPQFIGHVDVIWKHVKIFLKECMHA